MPPVQQKQVPPKPQVPTTNKDAPASMLATAVPTQRLTSKYWKVCIYGRNRIGKTTLACCFPKPLLLLAMEPTETGGADSVSGENVGEGISCIRIGVKPVQVIDPATGERQFHPDGRPVLEKYAGTRKAGMIVEELRQLGENNPYKTVVIDTITAFQDIILTELMSLAAVPEMLSWGLVSDEQYRQRSEKMRQCLRPFLDLRCHTILVAQEKDHSKNKDRGTSKLMRPMQEESYIAADLGGATVNWVHDSCGYVAQLFQDRKIEIVETKVPQGDKVKSIFTERDTGRIVRRLRTLYHPQYAAGFRSPTPGAVPEYIEAATPELMYQEMTRVMSGIKTAHGKYSE